MVIAVSCSVIYVRHSCRKVSNAAASYPGGMGGMEILKNHLEIAVDMAGRKLPKGEVYHSVDLDPTCQRVLLGHNPVHVFKDILQLLKLPVRIAVQRVMKEKEAHVQQLLAESQNSDTPKQKTAAEVRPERSRRGSAEVPYGVHGSVLRQRFLSSHSCVLQAS